MKKYFSNIRSLAALLMAGAAFAACSSDESVVTKSSIPAISGEQGYTLTIMAGKAGKADTRALDLDGEKLVASWEEGDELKVYKADDITECIEDNYLGSLFAGSVSEDGQTATFSTASFAGAENLQTNDKLTLLYHSDALDFTSFMNQNGTLSDASDLDFAVATVTVDEVDQVNHSITIQEDEATFETRTAVLKLTLQDVTTPAPTLLNATQLKVSATLTLPFIGDLIVDLASFTIPEATYNTNGNGVLYFALPDVEDLAKYIILTKSLNPSMLAYVKGKLTQTATLTYYATVGTYTYGATKIGYPFAGGTYYASTLTMEKKLLSNATTADCGMVVCAAGHLHLAKTAVPSGCTAVGILGKVTATGHGLILALQDATQQSWNTINGWNSVTTYASTTLKQLPAGALGSLTSYTTLGTTQVSNWCVAQKSDYDAIFTNLGSTESDPDGTTYDANVNAYITTGVGGTAIDGDYWSATEDDNVNGFFFFSYCWDRDSKGEVYSLRPVLGF